MSCGLLVVFVGDGRFDAVAAQPKVDKVVDALLAFRDATLKENNKGQINMLPAIRNAILKENNSYKVKKQILLFKQGFLRNTSGLTFLLLLNVNLKFVRQKETIKTISCKK